ncbi:MAG: phenylacetate-CoA oxygenase/reductase subunit PaaK [Streptosporangiales bacterium]|nr:phenylacetate-CoA oxygenase/reductase subunit PaaK [Streptosporangiales bacterium]
MTAAKELDERGGGRGRATGRRPTDTAAAPAGASGGGGRGRNTSTQEATGRHQAVFHELRVAAVDALTDDAYAVTLDVPDTLAGEYRHAAGQHVNIRCTAVGDEERRSYSICTPAGSGILRIGVKHLPGGAFSAHVARRLRPGDVLEVMTPTGRFTPALDPAASNHYGLVAAGSGITPVLSIASTVLATEPGSRVTLFYGNRTSSSVMFVEELYDLKNTYPDRFSLVHVLSREPQQVELFSGRLDPDRFDRLLRALCPLDQVDEWFLCGPFAMVQELRAYLRDRGAARVHVELFHADPPAPPQPPAPTKAQPGASTVTAVLGGRATTFRLGPYDVPVLEAMLRERGDAPYACRGGVCGTCRARLLEGEVRMDQNYALEDTEVANGYVLTCQSHPVSPTVRLEYDA